MHALNTFVAARPVGSAATAHWSLRAAASIPPILLVCYLCCRYERAELLLGLFTAEWLLVLAAWRLLCPRLGIRSIQFAAVSFLVSFLVATLITREHAAEYGALWTWSDDWWYLNHAQRVVHSLHHSGWNLLEAWRELTSIWVGAAWTLVGWPYVLGLVTACVTSNPSFEMVHAIALSLNATCLAIVLAIVFHVLGQRALAAPTMAFFCFLLLAADPIVYACHALKESMLQLCLMLAFVACVRLSGGIRLKWCILGIIGFVGVATTRTAYIPLLLVVLYWSILDTIRLSTPMKVGIAIIVVALFAQAFLAMQIRQYTISEHLAGKQFEGADAWEAGLATSIYAIPLVGPPAFYAIAPVPPLPWKLLSYENVTTTLIRGFGSVAWFLSLCYVVRGILRNRSLLQNRLFAASAFMWLGLFTATVLTGDDPRYKQPTNFFLAIMLFLVWCAIHNRWNTVYADRTGGIGAFSSLSAEARGAQATLGGERAGTTQPKPELV